MGFTLDIKGQLNSIRLHESKALWPLYEAVVNSIHAIEDSSHNESGKILIYAHREEQLPNLFQGRFDYFQITDNGIGFNSENYRSFNTAYSTFKIRKGCKGIGRFLWLKAFCSVAVQSVYQEQEKYYKREFAFTPDGVDPEENNSILVEQQEPKTIVTLKDFKSPYREHCPVELEAIANKIIEHCLLFFIAGNCPNIVLYDDYSDSIDLNQYFQTKIQDSLHQDHFNIRDNSFILYHLRVPIGASSHEIHFCANKQEVKPIDLKKYIPDLQRKITTNEDPVGFYYVGYLTSPYLDSIVNTTRTGFDYDELEGQFSLFGTGKDTLLKTVLEFVNSYLSSYLSDIQKKKRKEIDDFVSQDRPTYRFLLKLKPEIYDLIPAGLKPEGLEFELHKQVQEWETEVKRQGQELERAVKDKVAFSDATYHELFEKYWSGITELSKTCLAEYVARRKTLLTILEDTLSIQENGRFKKEDAIHSIICPIRHTSDDVKFEEMNLWIIDERLAYHRYLASDKTIKSLPDIDSRSTKELDIAIFDRPFAFSEDETPFNTITIIEFKKPDNKKDNPLSQMGGYIDEIVAGQKKRANGLSFGDCTRTSFRCFAICDLTPRMKAHCKDAGFRLTPDGMGYYGYQPERNAYYEVISYAKLLSDAKKRNQILFDKLFEPKLSEILHL